MRALASVARTRRPAGLVLVDRSDNFATLRQYAAAGWRITNVRGDTYRAQPVRERHHG